MKKYIKYLNLIIFTMGSQALLYYSIKLFVSDFNVIHSIIDIPLIKPFILFYDSWYPFIILSTYIVYKYDQKQFNYMISAMLIGALLAQITFILFPSMIVRPEIEINNIFDLMIDLTYKSDNPPVNCFPSMHCVYCFVTSYYILRCKKLKPKYKLLITIFSLLIVLSTVFIKQHIVEDIALAFIYTVMAIIIVYLTKINIDILFDFKKYIKSTN